MSTWTKELPKESGFYWFRNEGLYPCVVEWWAEEGLVRFTGSDIYLWTKPMTTDGDTIANTNGEFWSERLTKPQP